MVSVNYDVVEAPRKPCEIVINGLARSIIDISIYRTSIATKPYHSNEQDGKVETYFRM